MGAPGGLTHPLSVRRFPPDCWDVYGVSKILGEEVCRVPTRHDPEAAVLALRLVYPCTDDEWKSRGKRGPLDWWQPIGPQDSGRLFLAALDCTTPGAHILNVSGDVGGTVSPNVLARETIGWAPRGE